MFYVPLIVLLLLAALSASARKGNDKDMKPAGTTSAKSGTEAAPATKAASVLPVASPGDTTANNVTAPFYHPKKKRYINLQDLYVGVGGAMLHSAGGNNSPFHNGLSANGCYGIPLINKYLLLEFSNNFEFLFSADKNWYSNAYRLPESKLSSLALGFDDEFALDLQVVIAGSRKLSFSAGPLAGARLTDLPSMLYNSKLYHLSVPMSICYGLKADLFIGDRFYCYAQYSNILAGSLTSYTSQAGADDPQFEKKVPVDFGLIRVGVGYVLKPWW